MIFLILIPCSLPVFLLFLVFSCDKSSLGTPTLLGMFSAAITFFAFAFVLMGYITYTTLHPEWSISDTPSQVYSCLLSTLQSCLNFVASIVISIFSGVFFIISAIVGIIFVSCTGYFIISVVKNKAINITTSATAFNIISNKLN